MLQPALQSFYMMTVNDIKLQIKIMQKNAGYMYLLKLFVIVHNIHTLSSK